MCIRDRYLAIDCGAISDELAASEFFGHQKGAFTGAESDKVGLFRAVNGGTLFLDEIGNLSYKTQMLLLRALQEKRCKPVGSTKEYSFDIRLVAATNENLEKAIGEGRFREMCIRDRIWNMRKRLKTKLISYIKWKCGRDWLKSQVDPALGVSIFEKFNPNALLVGFGRRFATYKRAHLLFTDLDRLARIVNNQEHPIQFVFAGKAHPNDTAGQGLIKQIVEISRRPEFLGKIIFLENYDMDLARHLISGVDIWMNTPTRLAEASGTSGEKALMNGVLNFSVLDGWWYEGYRKEAGWAITDKATYQDEQYQNLSLIHILYCLFEYFIY